MTTIRAIIADDEAQLRHHLKHQLIAAWPEIDICAEAENGRQALELVAAHRPDVVFLDIRMPGLSGMEVARRIADSAWIVFVTAYDQYAVEAFEKEAIDYLMKPVTPERLETTVRRLKDRISRPPEQSGSIQNALDYLAAITEGRKGTGSLQWIRAQHGNDIRLIPVEDVLYFKAQDKYTLVITRKGESLIRKPVKELGLELDPDRFWQINRGVIINVAAVDTVSRSMTGRYSVRLKDHSDLLLVSRNFTHLFKQM